MAPVCIAQSLSDSIRGVERYYDPNQGREVELPAGYTNVWGNPLGEYVLSESPSFNPNQGSNLHWQQIQRRQVAHCQAVHGTVPPSAWRSAATCRPDPLSRDRKSFSHTSSAARD